MENTTMKVGFINGRPLGWNGWALAWARIKRTNLGPLLIGEPKLMLDVAEILRGSDLSLRVDPKRLDGYRRVLCKAVFLIWMRRNTYGYRVRSNA